MGSNLVLTPGGYRNASLVHRVEPGHALRVSAGKVRIANVAARTEREVQEVVLKPGDVPGFGTGWISYAYWLNTTGHPVNSLKTTWRVPPAPTTQSGQTIFLFNGLDPNNPSDAILQPVLQWGPSFAGGGSYWSVASWYVGGDGHAFYTPLVQVNVGDTLLGKMTLTGKTGGKFNYVSEFEGIGGTSLPVENVDELAWCNQTLEAYGITRCSDYPAVDSTPMRSIELQTDGALPTITWTAVDQVTDCGQHTVVVSNSATDGEVDIYYRNAALRARFEELIGQVEILFGVANDGGGIAILPNGQIIHIPPWNPDNALFRKIADGLAEVGRGFAVAESVRDSPSPGARKEINGARLKMMSNGLTQAARAIDEAVSTSKD